MYVDDVDVIVLIYTYMYTCAMCCCFFTCFVLDSCSLCRYICACFPPHINVLLFIFIYIYVSIYLFLHCFLLLRSIHLQQIDRCNRNSLISISMLTGWPADQLTGWCLAICTKAGDKDQLRLIPGDDFRGLLQARENHWENLGKLDDSSGFFS